MGLVRSVQRRRLRGGGACALGVFARWECLRRGSPARPPAHPLSCAPSLPRRASDRPGSKLTLRLATNVGDTPGSAVDLMLGLLHSWQGMGQVEVACTRGCT